MRSVLLSALISTCAAADGLTFTPPLYESGGVVSMAPAGENTPGYIKGDPSAVQYMSGLFVFQQEPSFSSNASYGSGLTASADLYHGLACGGPIFPNANGLGLALIGRRTDRAQQVHVGAAHWVDGGILFQVDAPAPCNLSAPPMFAVTDTEVSYGGVVTPSCDNPSDTMVGSLVDASRVAGHVSLRSAPENQLTLMGDLAANHRAVYPDGGRPSAADFDPGVVLTEPDGGTYFAVAGLHGSVSHAAADYMSRGFIIDATNPGGANYPHVWAVDWIGGMAPVLAVNLSDFPGPAYNLLTSEGQYYPNGLPATLRYAADAKHWYFEHGDAGYQQFAEQPDVSALQAQVATLLARVTALEAR